MFTRTAYGARAEAAVITDFMRRHKILVRIIGGFASPSFNVYQLEMHPEERFSNLENVLDDLQRVLYAARLRGGAIQPGEPDARVIVRATAQPLQLEINRIRPEILTLDQARWDARPFVALAGLAYVMRAGRPVEWRLADERTPHVLVAGTSGSGKSSLLISLLLTLAQGTPPDVLTLYIIDGGNSSLKQAGRLLHTAVYAGDAEGALDVARHAAAIVHERRRLSDTTAEHRVVLVVDELANLLAAMDRSQAGDIQRDLATVAAEGRKFGVHLVACTQKPLAEVTGTLVKSNLALRFVGAVTSWQDARTAADMPGTGAERLLGRGDFLVRRGLNVQRFQAPYVADAASLVASINRNWSHRAPAAVELHAALDNDASAAGAGNDLAADAVEVPDVLVPVFEQFTQPDGSLRRGGMAAALRALYGADAPQSGKRYQMEYDRVMVWHNRYFTSLRRQESDGWTVLPSPELAGSEVKIWM